MARDPVSAFMAGFMAVDQYETNKQLRAFREEEMSHTRKVWERQDELWAREELKYMQEQRVQQAEMYAGYVMQDLERRSKEVHDRFLETGGTLIVDGKEETFEAGDREAARIAQGQWLQNWYDDDLGTGKDLSPEERFMTEVFRRWGQADPEAMEHLALAFGRDPSAGPLVDPKNPVANVGIVPGWLSDGNIKLWMEYNRKDGGRGPATKNRTDSPNDPVDFLTANTEAMVKFFGPAWSTAKTPMIFRWRQQIDAQEAQYYPRGRVSEAEQNAGGAAAAKAGAAGTSTSGGGTTRRDDGGTYQSVASDYPGGGLDTKQVDDVISTLVEQNIAPTPEAIKEATSSFLPGMTDEQASFLASKMGDNGARTGGVSPLVGDLQRSEGGGAVRGRIPGPGETINAEFPGRETTTSGPLVGDLQRSEGGGAVRGRIPGPGETINAEFPGRETTTTTQSASNNGGLIGAATTVGKTLYDTAGTVAKTVGGAAGTVAKTIGGAVSGMVPSTPSEVPNTPEAPKETYDKKNAQTDAGASRAINNAPAATESSAPQAAKSVAEASASHRRVPFRHELYNAATLVQADLMSKEDFMTFAKTGSLPDDVEWQMFQTSQGIISVGQDQNTGEMLLGGMIGTGGAGGKSVKDMQAEQNLWEDKLQFIEDKGQRQRLINAGIETKDLFGEIFGGLWNTNEQEVINSIAEGTRLLSSIDQNKIQGVWDKAVMKFKGQGGGEWTDFKPGDYNARLNAATLGITTILGHYGVTDQRQATQALIQYAQDYRPGVAGMSDTVFISKVADMEAKVSSAYAAANSSGNKDGKPATIKITDGNKVVAEVKVEPGDNKYDIRKRYINALLTSWYTRQEQ